MTTRPSKKDRTESHRQVPPLATAPKSTFSPQIRPKALWPNLFTYKMNTQTKLSKWVSHFLIEYICRGPCSDPPHTCPELQEPRQSALSCWSLEFVLSNTDQVSVCLFCRVLFCLYEAFLEKWAKWSWVQGPFFVSISDRLLWPSVLCFNENSITENGPWAKSSWSEKGTENDFSL